MKNFNKCTLSIDDLAIITQNKSDTTTEYKIIGYLKIIKTIIMATIAQQGEDKVKQATPSSINEKIENETWQRVSKFINSNTDDITARIHELEKEWDIERYLGVNMSTLAMSGLAAGAVSKNKNWLILPAVVLGFFFQHSVQGWCPPLPIMRLLKLRTRKEIEQEKYALKILRGDFNDLQTLSLADIEKLKKAIKLS